eukprot:TRINITY_DN40913_c0_g2_i2.p1 TRINITY_DN40913_c0_g2~~TRINITY_DN40913_c0_g2_i2.p1  ORF type:complete len:1316 (+),score=242.35 TRINITY_DN40913_c0_g2_i2:153-3950(+)
MSPPAAGLQLPVSPSQPMVASAPLPGLQLPVSPSQPMVAPAPPPGPVVAASAPRPVPAAPFKTGTPVVVTSSAKATKAVREDLAKGDKMLVSELEALNSMVGASGDPLAQRVTDILRKCKTRLHESRSALHGLRSQRDMLSHSLHQAEGDFMAMQRDWNTINEDLDVLRHSLSPNSRRRSSGGVGGTGAATGSARSHRRSEPHSHRAGSARIPSPNRSARDSAGDGGTSAERIGSTDRHGSRERSSRARTMTPGSAGNRGGANFAASKQPSFRSDARQTSARSAQRPRQTGSRPCMVPGSATPSTVMTSEQPDFTDDPRNRVWNTPNLANLGSPQLTAPSSTPSSGHPLRQRVGAVGITSPPMGSPGAGGDFPPWTGSLRQPPVVSDQLRFTGCSQVSHRPCSPGAETLLNTTIAQDWVGVPRSTWDGLASTNNSADGAGCGVAVPPQHQQQFGSTLLSQRPGWGNDFMCTAKPGGHTSATVPNVAVGQKGGMIGMMGQKPPGPLASGRPSSPLCASGELWRRPILEPRPISPVTASPRVGAYPASSSIQLHAVAEHHCNALESQLGYVCTDYTGKQGSSSALADIATASRLRRDVVLMLGVIEGSHRSAVSRRPGASVAATIIGGAGDSITCARGAETESAAIGQTIARELLRRGGCAEAASKYVVALTQNLLPKLESFEATSEAAPGITRHCIGAMADAVFDVITNEAHDRTSTAGEIAKAWRGTNVLIEDELAKRPVPLRSRRQPLPETPPQKAQLPPPEVMSSPAVPVLPAAVAVDEVPPRRLSTRELAEASNSWRETHSTVAAASAPVADAVAAVASGPTAAAAAAAAGARAATSAPVDGTIARPMMASPAAAGTPLPNAETASVKSARSSRAAPAKPAARETEVPGDPEQPREKVREIIKYRCPVCSEIVDTVEEALAHCSQGGGSCGSSAPAPAPNGPSQDGADPAAGNFAGGTRETVAMDGQGRPSIARQVNSETGEACTIVWNEDGSQLIFGEEVVQELLKKSSKNAEVFLRDLTSHQLRGLVHEMGQRLLQNSQLYHHRLEELKALGDKLNYMYFGLTPGASEKDLDNAYRKLAKKMHPDKNGGTEEAKIRFQHMKERYEALKKRREGDPSAGSSSAPRRDNEEDEGGEKEEQGGGAKSDGDSGDDAAANGKQGDREDADRASGQVGHQLEDGDTPGGGGGDGRKDGNGTNGNGTPRKGNKSKEQEDSRSIHYDPHDRDSMQRTAAKMLEQLQTIEVQMETLTKEWKRARAQYPT